VIIHILDVHETIRILGETQKRKKKDLDLLCSRWVIELNPIWIRESTTENSRLRTNHDLLGRGFFQMKAIAVDESVRSNVFFLVVGA